MAAQRMMGEGVSGYRILKMLFARITQKGFIHGVILKMEGYATSRGGFLAAYRGQNVSLLKLISSDAGLRPLHITHTETIQIKPNMRK